MILRMKRVQLFGLRSEMEEVVRVLHRIGTLHIDDIREVPDAPVTPIKLDEHLIRQSEELRYLASQVNGLLEILAKAIQDKVEISTVQFPVPKDEIRSGVNELTPRIKELTEKRNTLKAEQETLPKYIQTLRQLIPLMPPSAKLAGNNTVGILINRSHSGALEMIQERILSITEGKAEIISGNMDESTLAVMVVFPQSYISAMEALLVQEDITRLRLPAQVGYQPPDTALSILIQRNEDVPYELQQIDQDLQALAQTWLGRCTAWQRTLQDELECYDILPRFGETGHTFVIYGWLPERLFESFKEQLQENTKGKVLLQQIEIPESVKNIIPVALENPAPVQPFESLVNLLARPRYHGIDPSGLMFLFLPLFFGMILGDIGYGILILIACLFMLKGTKSGILGDILKVILIGSCWSILFGFLYGELFGTVGEHLGLRPLWMDRANAKNLLSLLYIAVGIGGAHILLGLILGIWSAWVEKSRSHLLERAGLLAGLCGMFLLVGTIANWLPDPLMTPAVAVIILGMVLLGIPSGKPGILVGPLEMLSLVGNILSYMRIAAIGLASVYLAKVANEMVGLVGSLFVGIIIAVLIHALNLVMGVFSPSIHSLRLHYVEFFRKFYEGGGKPYQPFCSRLSTKVRTS